MHESEIVKKAIIKKLYAAGCWGKGHMLIDRFKSGLPPHFRGEVQTAAKELVKEGLICVYGKTKYGLAFYLNIARKREIEEIIEKNL